MLERVWKKGDTLALLLQLLWKTVWRFLKKLGIKQPYDPAIPLLGIYLEETKIGKDTCTRVHCSTIYDSYNREAAICPLTDEWIKKL